MTEEIILYIVALMPSLTAILTAIASMVTIIKNFATLRKDVKEKVEMEELKKKLEVTLSECRELEALLRKEIETRTHIKQ